MGIRGIAAIRPLGDLLYWTPKGVTAGQTNTWIGQKSYDEFSRMDVFLALGEIAAKLGRNVLRPYKGRTVRDGDGIRSGRGRIRVGRF
jgi:hypothetical protein